MKEYNYFSKTSYTYKEASEILTQKLKNENPSRIISEGHPEPYTAYDLDHIAKAINKYNIDCYVIENRKNDFQNYLLKAQYPKNYIDRFNRFFTEKAYEHFIILELMKLCNNQIYIDIASCYSPLWNIATQLYKTNSFSQDIMYPDGINNHIIGCDACNLPFEEHSIDALSAACSIEHFENDGDILLFKEAQRVLRHGGVFVVAPFYLAKEECIITDPINGLDVKFDHDDNIRFVEKWNNRHGRYYSISSFCERIIKPHPEMEFKLYAIKDLHEIGEVMYCNFALVAIRK